uniref:uncharacterized protein LOC120325813 n=1 Tax=Styela clava TaxID=7725 RepID=UPI00193998BD|nr:uncharacterized protein LOC120325813 [Styela clava]
MESCIKNAVFLTLISFAIFVRINASCEYDIFEDDWCKHTVKTATMRSTMFYRAGEKWKDGPCVDCSCGPETYKTVLNCSLEVENGKARSDEAESYFVNIDNVYPTSCPFGFTEITTENRDLASQMFIVYRVVDTVSKTCCTRMNPSEIPEECEAIRSDECEYKFVLKSNNGIPCPGPIFMSG